MKSLVACCVALACTACSSRSPTGSTTRSTTGSSTGSAGGLQFDVSAVDPHADPCNDFYAYACGGWLRTHPIPDDRERWSRYAEIAALDLDRERAIAEAEAEAAATPPTRLGTYYAACMDERGLEARGLAPIQDLMQAIDQLAAPAAVTPLLAELHRRVGGVLFKLDVDADPSDSRRQIAYLGPGDFGLDDPDDYQRADAGSVATRATYAQHVERLLRLAGDRDAAGDAPRVVALETQLARALPPAAVRRHAESEPHTATLAALASHAPAIDWPAYARAIGAPHLDHVDLLFASHLEAVNAALSDLPALRAYLRYRVARTFAPVLPHALDAEVFDFTRHGAKAPQPRWQRCLDFIERDLRDDLGQAFAAKYFTTDARDRARAEVDRIAAALHAELAASSWLSPAAKQLASRKLDHMKFLVGYPDKLTRYDDVAVRRDDPVGNAERAGAASFARALARLDQPTDRDEFYDPITTVHGSSSNLLVSVVFPAGFMQPPVFDPRVDAPINFGGFGGVIGHEITHNFDDEGRKFDGDGNVAPWWSDADVTAYRAHAACFSDEYARFQIEDGEHLDGDLTLSENIADNGGLRLAWDALQPAFEGAKIDGFTPAQRFFLAWGQIRCENITPEALRAQVHGNPHSPGRFRVDGVVVNLPEFARAFSCPAGAPMAPANRCTLW